MNYHSDEWIMGELERHHQKAVEKYGNDRILGTFLYGSQNYQIDTEKSDIDTISIYIPSLRALVDGARKPEDKIILGKDQEEICFVYDIRYYIDGLASGVLSYLEMLHTKYSIVNPKYQKEWEWLRVRRDQLARIDEVAWAQRITEQCERELGGLTGPAPTEKLQRVLAQKGYIPKYLYHSARLDYFAKEYAAGHPYSDLFRDPLPEICERAKRGEFTVSEARKLEDDIVANIKTNLRKLTRGRQEFLYKQLKEQEEKIIYKGLN